MEQQETNKHEKDIINKSENSSKRSSVSSVTECRARPSFEIQIGKSASADDALEAKKKPDEFAKIRRRGSLDEKPTSYSPAFLIHVDRTRDLILDQEDTDKNAQITIEDSGPKHLLLTTAHSHGLKYRSIHGHYMIANLLQELALAGTIEDHESTKEKVQKDGTSNSKAGTHIIIEERVLNENPIYRLCKMITGHFWPNLRRSLDVKGLKMICLDAKNRGKNQRARIWIPKNDTFAQKFYQKVSEGMDLDVKLLPESYDEKFVQSINDEAGILSLQLRKKNKLGLWVNAEADDCEIPEDLHEVKGVPFIVPGGRFNEMYGWDSYFSTLGLLQSIEDTNRCRLDDLYMAKSMADNFAYEILHYGKILNANRSYYLLRTQPPFFTDMTWKIYEELLKFVNEPQNITGAEVEGYLLSETPIEWLGRMTDSAIREYFTVWMSEPRFMKEFGLSRYYGAGRGLPPETEESHFNAVLLRFAKQSTEYEETEDSRQIARDYNSGKFKSSELDEYFLHDRAVRESGHDTTYRLDGRCANLLTVDLNSLLYRYEVDIAKFLDTLGRPGSEEWRQRALKRKEHIDRYLWNEETGQYYDYDFVKGKPVIYDSATAFWPMWSGACSEVQADRLINTLLPKLEMRGGLVSGTEESRGSLSLDRPSRQWDYPYGWAPHQILLWHGLISYGHNGVAHRMAYRWLFTILKAYVNYHGVVPEKFNVVTGSHRISAEYGNVGTDFRMIAREGFGWMNASFMIGLRILNKKELRALGALIEPEQLFK